MILCWLKITYYKIVKELKRSWSDWCRIQAQAGTDPQARAHVMRTVDGYGVAPKAETSMEFSVGMDPTTRTGIAGFQREPGAPDDTIKTDRLRRLIELGLVSAPDPGLNDFIRLAALDQDRRAREEAAGLDPSRCPCSGRHFPSADGCAWCRCHDPRNLFHTEGPRGIMQVIKPQTDPDRPLLQPIIDEARVRMSHRPCSVCGDPAHAGSTHDEILAVRPPAEIVCCSRCGHPSHTPGSGRCAVSVPSRMQDEGFHPCGCDHDAEDGHA